jgi:DedD protein
MEKKKLLLVAISVGVFLVIVTGAAILVFSRTPSLAAAVMASAGSIPAGVSGTNSKITSQNNNPGEISPVITVDQNQPASVDAADMVRNPTVTQGLQPSPATTAIQENNFYINSENPGQAVAVEKLPENNGSKVIINVPRPSSAAVPDTPPAGKAARTSTTAPERPAAVQTAARVKPASVPPAASKTPARPATVQTKPYDDYWVQTGAFSIKARADGAKETLAAKGISSVIENREVDGKTFFRVRVGPYTSQNEAVYWLSLIKSISGFEDSQIRKSQSRR